MTKHITNSSRLSFILFCHYTILLVINWLSIWEREKKRNLFFKRLVMLTKGFFAPKDFYINLLFLPLTQLSFFFPVTVKSSCLYCYLSPSFPYIFFFCCWTWYSFRICMEYLSLDLKQPTKKFSVYCYHGKMSQLPFILA